MTHKIIVEQHLLEHPRCRQLQATFPRAAVLTCQRYQEVFNPKAQNFRLQKQRPAWILAEKQQGLVLPTPPGFGIGGQHNYYFSHLLNCPYDCRYCFLQGMYRSANYVWFINHEDFMQQIEQTIQRHAPEPCYFFSGYDGDSLALEPVTGFVNEFVEFFAARPEACLELRTKSSNVRALLRIAPTPNVIVAFSLTPDEISRQVEHKVPVLQKRLVAMQQLAQHGWRLGLRFDPVLDMPDFKTQYTTLLQQIFSCVPASAVHSVSIGALRFPDKMLKKIVQYYPNDKILHQVAVNQHGEHAYATEREAYMLSFVRGQVMAHIPEDKIFKCY